VRGLIDGSKLASQTLQNRNTCIHMYTHVYTCTHMHTHVYTRTSPNAAPQPTNSAKSPYLARLTNTSETAALNLHRTDSDWDEGSSDCDEGSIDCDEGSSDWDEGSSDWDEGSSDTKRAHLALRVEILAIAGAPVGEAKGWCWQHWFALRARTKAAKGHKASFKQQYVQ
jgi:hypothetical protein